MIPRIAISEEDAWNQVHQLDRCTNCVFFIDITLFDGTCQNPEGSKPFKIPGDGSDSTCECFRARSKKVEYWIRKLVGMSQEFSGNNDFMRRLEYHQRKGTDHEFLFGKP